MAAWNDGYVFDVAYTTGFYREIAPAWMATAALLLGHRPPDIARPFRWAELGCGHGLSANVFAAGNPQAEFHGFDFNPSHIENARRLAGRAGLSNAHFHEMSFGDLADLPDGRIPQFDFIVAHGIWSWVSDTSRQQMMRAIRRFLAPGGLVYISYNTLTGWASMVPVQRFMREWARANPGSSPEATASALKFLGELMKSDAAFFPANPAVAARLEPTANMDAKYLAHEYLNANWDPTNFVQVADVMAEAKCGYIGSATLIENIDAVAIPPNAAKILAGVTDARLKELIRDFGANKTFRRDLYRRGTDQPMSGEQRELLDQVMLVGMGREKETTIQVPTGIGQLGLRMEIYTPILERLAQGPMTIRELRQTPSLARQPLSESLQAAAFMMAGGLAHPVPREVADPAAVAACQAMNAQIAAYNSNGGALGVLAAPLTGSGFSADYVETVMLPELIAGQDVADVLVDKVLAKLAATGRSVVREGKPVTDPALARTDMTATVNRLLTDRRPLYRRLGVMGA